MTFRGFHQGQLLGEHVHILLDYVTDTSLVTLSHNTNKQSIICDTATDSFDPEEKHLTSFQENIKYICPTDVIIQSSKC